MPRDWRLVTFKVEEVEDDHNAVLSSESDDFLPRGDLITIEHRDGVRCLYCSNAADLVWLSTGDGFEHYYRQHSSMDSPVWDLKIAPAKSAGEGSSDYTDGPAKQVASGKGATAETKRGRASGRQIWRAT
ncbi:hypothetical protein BHE74_00030289 [Ensete ventricosum]|nr:hypothetical protein GW17_00039688 [Ensete ventricosum]RWW62566.1 hypothetical protein BHE74_00030289 [Ensete ventricosum]RZS08249.1 hypothetical protein BHM03_00039187 [Ensete ventricosum]